MVYESSYESGRKPFHPDVTRGYWAEPSDFVIISMALAFKLDFFFAPMTFFIRAGIGIIIPYILCFALYVVPILVIQSFMGQFSSSGYLSAFRVSPFFKGIGYISLALNFCILTYYSVFATIPILFLFSSFSPTLPWSCEVFEGKDFNWNATREEKISICNATDVDLSDVANDTRIIYELPSVLFLQSYIDVVNFEAHKLTFSWILLLCTILTWAIIAAIFYKFFNTAKLGRLLRYGILTTLSLLIVCSIRFLFLPGAANSLEVYVTPDHEDVFMGAGNVLFYSMSAFGPGWGSIVSLSSHNKFNRNIMRDSWIISIGQMLITMLFHFNAMLVFWHFTEITNNNYFNYIENHWDIYVSSASAIANMRFANFWSIVYYTTLTIAALIVMVTQLYTILVTIFDEFVLLRAYKMKVTFTMIGVLAFFSLYLCTNEGIMNFSALSGDALFTQASLHLLLLLVVLWVYGRERFQRDIEFMLGQPFATWKVNMLRFVSPFAFLFLLFVAIVNVYYEHMFSTTLFLVLAIIFIVMPWISIPAYGIFMVLETSGSLWARIKRSCRPTDWYPVEQKDRQRYEESMGNENITHQLNEFGEEVL